MTYSWVVWMVAGIGILYVVFAPKRLPAHECCFLVTFTSSFALVFDLIVGSVYDLYDYGKGGNVELLDIVQVAAINPSLGLALLNFWPRRDSFWIKLLYWGLWTGGLLLLEELWLHLGLLTYRDWSIWKSMLCYPFLFGVLRLGQSIYRGFLPK
ncbi:CBO0543 family protein [Tumebacillus flagellatus]|uniref:Uncharacterized protein n=1 Tax=Tumebacillus flagellatus TaxID=1157490 RepID=A0A074LSP6_9BACL|nr:CBO0543 family protein [Tumebacillus flagellatus]KEO85156.1 hypothetical protein EL26_00950 [Tumebacillus flagellatus]